MREGFLALSPPMKRLLLLKFSTLVQLLRVIPYRNIAVKFHDPANSKCAAEIDVGKETVTKSRTATYSFVDGTSERVWRSYQSTAVVP